MDPARARRLLEAERDRATSALATGRRFRSEESEDDVFAEMSSVDQHQADAGSETFQQEVDATIVAMESDRLEEIEDALLRLASGTYGDCETCGVAIPDDRLEAEPAARFCIVHERSWELRELDLTTPVLSAGPGGTQWGLPPDAGTIAMGDLPTDDDVEEHVELSADETLEIETTHVQLDPDDTERFEADEGGRQADERAEAVEAEREATAAIEDTLRAERELDARD